MIIKVLTSNCTACQETCKIIKNAVNNLHRNDIDVFLVNDIMEIMNYNILTPPAIVIDEKVIFSGHIHSEAEAMEILKKHISI